MKVPGLISFGLLTLLYLCVLLYLDRENHVFEHGVALAKLSPQVAVFALASFLLRFVRWRWLLGRRHFLIPWRTGLLAYLSGFALTASPGKVGELLRVRYFGTMGVPTDQVIGCFIFERMLDLIAILLLSTLLAGSAPGLTFAIAFVILVIVTVIVVSRSAARWKLLAQWLDGTGWHNAARSMYWVGSGLANALTFFTPCELSVSLVLGLAAWTVQSLGFVYILGRLEVVVPPIVAFAVYPLALLLGAASMLPGGIGTTEAAIVLLLNSYGVPLDRAALAAVGMRVSTLWFAIALGFASIAILEIAGAKHKT
jgi:uncharacterized membrane protein YbhN (UPF0104 family)